MLIAGKLFSLAEIEEYEGEEIQSSDIAESAQMLFEHMAGRDRKVCTVMADQMSIPLVDECPAPIYRSLCNDIMNTYGFADDRPIKCSGFSFKIITSNSNKPSWEIQWL